jgi:homogentisate 1,2-dioxygenase
VIHPTAQALALPTRQRDYQACWQGLRRHFDPTRR